MVVDAKVSAVLNIDIECDEAFRILCKTLDMEFVLDEDTEFFIQKDSDGNNCVYQMYMGCGVKVDDRGDLFVALRNVAAQIFHNVYFRNAEYIYN